MARPARLLVVVGFLTIGLSVLGATVQAPPGLFKKINEEALGDAVLISGKQLFIDDTVIAELSGVARVLNQPSKHPVNPLIVPDQPWEEQGYYANGSVLYDDEEKLFKIWYHLWKHDRAGDPGRFCGYATSTDGIRWSKPMINQADGDNRVSVPKRDGFCSLGVFKDPVETDPHKRFKMLYNERPDGSDGSWGTGAAYSADGIHWVHEPNNPLVPMSDTQNCTYWDSQRAHYVAYVRSGPPNVRSIARIDSEDFVHWSPKVTIFEQGELNIDGPFETKLYGMQIFPYERLHIGLLNAYHGETTQPIPQDKLWMDKLNVQLACSRNGLAWHRVGPHGAIPASEMKKGLDWKTISEQSTFLPYGQHQKDWDWGQIYPYQGPLVVGDEIRFYYTGIAARHFGPYHGDPFPPASGIGLATLRLDGFVSIETSGQGTMTTRPLVFIGDELEITADASSGSIAVEVLDLAGKPIPGFSRGDCQPLTSNDVRHAVKWNG